MVAFPSNPTMNQPYLNWMWDGSKWAPRPMANIPKCGFLSTAGSTASSSSIQFTPFEGDDIKINGIIYKIPPAGVTQAYTNCYIDGAAGQTLVSGYYYVYLFNNNGTLTMDFSARGPMVSTTAGNVGTIIKNATGNVADDTRTCIGLVWVSVQAPNAFFSSQGSNQVRSWFNRHNSLNHCWTSWSGSGVGTGVIVAFYVCGFSGESFMVQLDLLLSCPGPQVVAGVIYLNGSNTFSNQVSMGTNVFQAMSVGGSFSMPPGQCTVQGSFSVPSYLLGGSQAYLYGKFTT